MRCHCLTALEVKKYLSFVVGKEDSLDSDLALIFERAESWEIWLVCHNVFVARYINSDTHGEKKIEQIYAPTNGPAFDIQEGGDRFVNHLLRHQRLTDQTLDDALVEIQKSLSEHDYAKHLRY